MFVSACLTSLAAPIGFPQTTFRTHGDPPQRITCIQYASDEKGKLILSPIDYDDYELYEEQFDRFKRGRQARRKHKPGLKRSQQEIVSDMADADGIEGGFNPTYRPSKYEGPWLLSALQKFYHQALITDVLAQVKGGKEANVYRCAAHASTAMQFLAAKVYRPRMFRSLSNDKMYREGRQILTADGNVVKETDHRIMRAVGKKTAFGAQVSHTSWLMYEYKTLETLHQLGANVPKPLAVSENAILMSYFGDAQMAAPTLSQVELERGEADNLYQQVVHNIELMLRHGMIHGDLSAYNILYWEGEIILIDFPQVTNSRSNPYAQFILRRDVERICEYFSRQGVKTDANAILEQLVQRYMPLESLNPEMLEDDF
jgi:RIO kinase 1